MKSKSYWWLFLLVLFVSSLAYGQTTRDSLYVRTLGSYPSGQSYSVKCFQNGGHDYALAVFGEGIRIINIDSVAKPKVVSALPLYNSGRIIDIAIQGSFAYLSGGYDGLWIVDISDPYNPVKKGHCILPSSRNIIAVNAQYVFAGVFYDETTGGLHIIDISNPINPALVATYDSSFVGGIAVKDSLVFVTFDGQLHVLNVVDPIDIKILYVDSANYVSNGLLINGNYLYANANSVYDITDPANPVHYGTSGNGGYKYAIRDSALYGACGGVPDLVINKIENPVTITNLGSMDTPGYGMYLDAIDEKLCVSSNLSPEFNGMSIYNISTPYTPQLASYIQCIYDFGNGKSYVRNDTVVVCGKGIEIYDAADPIKPKLITALYDTIRNFKDVTWHQNHIYVVGYQNGIWAYDFSSRESLSLSDTLYLPRVNYSLSIEGNTAYVGADTTLCLIDISNPENLVLVAKAEYPGYIRDITTRKDLAFIAKYELGLYIYNVADKDSIFEIGHCLPRNSAYDLMISDNYVYVADNDSGLTIIDIADSTNPHIVGKYTTPGFVMSVTGDSNLVYIIDSKFSLDTDDSLGLRVIDVNDPSNPQEVGYYFLGYYEKGLDWWFGYMFGFSYSSGRIYASTLYGLQTYQYYGPSGVEANNFEGKHKYPFKLLSSYPNPAIKNLAINYEISTSGLYELSVYNVLGQKITVIDKGYVVPGKYSQNWNCKDTKGNKVAPGVYLYQLRDNENNRITKKTVVIK